MLEKGEYPAAIDHCNKALALDPGLFPARIILGHALQGSGRLEEAVQRYKELAAEGVEDSGLYNHYGEALLKLKQYQEAIPQFQRALQIDPSNTQARDNLSRALKISVRKTGVRDCNFPGEVLRGRDLSGAMLTWNLAHEA